MSQGSTSNPPEDSINIYTTQYATVENNYVTGGLDATTPSLVVLSLHQAAEYWERIVIMSPVPIMRLLKTTSW